MTWTVGTYVVYLLVTVPLTIWVATTLSRNGRVFLEDVFTGDDALANAVNKLLVVGFYLLNLGFVVLFLRISDPVEDLAGLFDTLSVKVGVVMLTLGVLHFFNVYVFNAIRRRSRMESLRSAAGRRRRASSPPVRPPTRDEPTDRCRAHRPGLPALRARSPTGWPASRCWCRSTLVPAGSAEARRRFPTLDHGAHARGDHRRRRRRVGAGRTSTPG